MTAYQSAISFLRKDGVLLVPTDTNYAFAVDPWNETACKRLYDIKKRDVRKPLTIFIARSEDLWKYVELTGEQREKVQSLVDKYWPGPLNLVLPKSESLPFHQYLMEDSVSLVCNSNPELRELITSFDRPLAMSSANLSGTQFDKLIDYDFAKQTFAAQVDYILPPGNQNTSTTQSSTIISLMGDRLHVLRQGDILIEAAER